MKENTKQYLIVTVVGVSLFVALMNLNTVLGFLGGIFELVLPIIAGCILALFISVPMNGIEKRLNNFFCKTKKKPSYKMVHVLSFVITLILVVLVIVVALTMLIPELIQSAKKLYEQLEVSIPNWITYLRENFANVEWLDMLISKNNLEKIMHSITDGVNLIFSNVTGVVSSTVSLLITSAFAVIISIYISLGKENLCRHAKKIVCAYLKPAWAENVLKFCNLFRQSFANFLAGQCGEAVILGFMMFLAFTIFRLPYGSLVGVLTAICAIIPYVGAFISCSVSVFLVIIIDPMLAVRCLIVYLVVQFIENQFIYPRVVGGSVGLPPLYTLIAAMIGGKLFGIIGIIFFIPLMAVIVELVKEDVNSRLKNKGKVKV